MTEHAYEVVAAFLGFQIAVLVGGWRFVLWVRGIVRDETRMITVRLDGIEKRLEAIPCKLGDCP